MSTKIKKTIITILGIAMTGVAFYYMPTIQKKFADKLYRKM